MPQATQADIEPMEDNAECSSGQEGEALAAEGTLEEPPEGSVAGEAGRFL